MNSDLERLIALQQLDSTAEAARRRLAEGPEHELALEARIEAARQRLAAAKEQHGQNQAARRELEKEVAVHQGRLSKFRDTLMAVKTNVEYQAVQKEMAFAQGEVKSIEDKVLERMIEADELTAVVKRAEGELAAEQKTVDADRRAMTAEQAVLQETIDRVTSERVAVVGALDTQVLATFDMVSRKRNGVAVAEARDGICTICHVRLRPQVFNTVTRNDAIIQCDSCNRILYYVPKTESPAVGTENSEVRT